MRAQRVPCLAKLSVAFFLPRTERTKPDNFSPPKSSAMPRGRPSAGSDDGSASDGRSSDEHDVSDVDDVGADPEEITAEELGEAGEVSRSKLRILLSKHKRGSKDTSAVCHVCLRRGHCAGFNGSVYIDCPNRPVRDRVSVCQFCESRRFMLTGCLGVWHLRSATCARYLATQRRRVHTASCRPRARMPATADQDKPALPSRASCASP